jgi:hypothetical protein
VRSARGPQDANLNAADTGRLQAFNPHPGEWIMKMAARSTACGLLPFLAAAALWTLATGCVAPQSHTKKDTALAGIPRQTRVLLMEPDIQIFELTAGGLQELKADWTEAGRANARTALIERLQSTDDTIVAYSKPQEPSELQADEQMVKLHDVVGGTIIGHNYRPPFQLPTKVGELDYTLGEDTQRLGRRHGADYALFIFIRDSHASPGRMAVMASAALLGIVVPGGYQQGFASLVDLKTGGILWCNLLFRQYGDLRKPEVARESVGILLNGLPL